MARHFKTYSRSGRVYSGDQLTWRTMVLCLWGAGVDW